MDDLEEVKTDATNTGTPSQEADSPEVKPEESQVEEELTNEQIDEQVKELKEQAKNSEDPKEKRHLEQYAGRLQQISKAREKAEQAESIARDKESRIAQLERLEIEDVYNKAINDEYGLEYFEKIAKEDPALAEKVAQEKWEMSAKQLIKQQKQNYASSGDEKAKEDLTREEIRAEIEHDFAIKQVQKIFDDLTESEKAIAQSKFDKRASKGLLTLEEATELAEDIKYIAMKDRKLDPVEKERKLADNANAPISKNNGQSSDSLSQKAQELLAFGFARTEEEAKRMASIKL